MRLVLHILATAVAVAVAAFLVPGITLNGPTPASRVLTLLVVAAIIGVVNAIVRPLVTLLSACLVLLTLGLFLFVINAGMLLLASSIAQWLGFGFYVDGLWPALFGSIIVSIVSGIMSRILDSRAE